ncbi:hypothetical protein [Lactobacillus helveticus]|uniref:hypothetical protein n=1 Tax=Lactobacillus helveticus TaxID=1587 RepID=UPI00191FC7A0|nr:hypothetical protein [Lactobacillus helveticus]NRO50424.1 hypothetical protein [Lactobacillus helveticus]NRO65028.1 hypothetical protein [Lactobacillus helveticus]NRO68887.1 hypothetical protein [Lactobacillus helveticus]NRO71134.1 hypothetical protein [Lactobacillus helveticus]
MEIINQNREDLIEYLLNCAFKHGISYTLVQSEPDDPAISFKQERKMYINTNWRNSNEIPFIIGHEIGHLMLGDQGIMYYESFSGQNSEEHSADLYSLNLIYNYSAKKGDSFQEPGTFIQNYGIPS